MSNPVADWGTVVVETDIDRALLAPLMMWLPTYMAQIERERDLAPHLLARPRAASFQNVLEDNEFPDAQLPAIIVTTAQTDGEPEPTIVGVDAAYAMNWRVNVSAVVRGRTPHETREVAALLGGCVRRLLTQQPFELGTVHWMGSLVTPFPDPSGQGRYLAAGVNRFRVFTDEALTGDGPLIPEPDDPEFPPPDPVGNPDQVYDPLPLVREGGVFTDVRYAGQPEPPPPGSATEIGIWSWRMAGVQSNPFFGGSICTDVALPDQTALYVATVDGLGTGDRRAELLAIPVGAKLELSYPQGNPAREFEADFTVTAPPVLDEEQPSDQVVIPVALDGAVGDSTHYGEDHDLRVIH